VIQEPQKMPSHHSQTQEYPASSYYGLLFSLKTLGRPTFLPSSCVKSVTTTHLLTHGQGVHRGRLRGETSQSPL